jgi:adhesin transport system outer membrane protein
MSPTERITNTVYRAIALGALGLLGAMPAWSAPRCNDLANPEPKGIREPIPLATGAGQVAPTDPYGSLQLLVRESVRRSQDVGASRLLADAAGFDVDETKGGRLPQVGLQATMGLGGGALNGRNLSTGMQANLGVSVNAPLYDFGKLDALIEWRSRLAEAARLGQGVSQERVALEAVSTAIERHRYRLQSQVYQQYARKMSCLVEALEQIVAEDKGRASELVQARKSQLQAELSRDQAQSTARQLELTLRKLVGDSVPLNDSFVGPLMGTPELDEVQRLIERGNDVMQTRREAEALDSYAAAVRAGQKPQLNWQVTRTQGATPDTRSTSWSAGLAVSMSVFNGYSDEAASKAALKRAESARQTLGQVVLDRQTKASLTHEAALSAMERARRYVDILRDSEKVRSATFQQWSQLGRRSLFDVMSAEGDHFAQRVGYVNALMDSAQSNASLRSLGIGLVNWMAN